MIESKKIKLTADEIVLCRRAVHATYQYLGADLPEIEDMKTWEIMEIVFDANYLQMACQGNSFCKLSDELYKKLDEYVKQEINSAPSIKSGFKKLGQIFW